VRLQLQALAYNLADFTRTLAMPKAAEPWSLTSLRERLIKTGAKVTSHGRYVTFQTAELAVPQQMLVDIPSLIARLEAPPAPEPVKGTTLAPKPRESSECRF
jgi:DDE family transposase